MSDAVPFEDYLSTVGRLTAHIDPTASTPEADDIKDATAELAALPTVDLPSLATWAKANPARVPVLGLVVGLGQEKLKNSLRDEFDTSGWVTLARERPGDLVAWLDRDFDLQRMLNVQRARPYTFGDVLVARAGSRVTATQAGQSGRKVKDEIEAIAADLGLQYETRTRFTGKVD